MSMSYALEAARDFLIATLGDGGLGLVKDKAVSIEPDGIPPSEAHALHICLDESDIDSRMSESTLDEQYGIMVWVCRRTSKYTDDRIGQLHYTTDLYYPGTIRTVEDIEHRIIAFFLDDKGETFRQFANTFAGFDMTSDPGFFQSPLAYFGRSRYDTVSDDEGEAWYRRPMRFFGLRRIREF